MKGSCIKPLYPEEKKLRKTQRPFISEIHFENKNLALSVSAFDVINVTSLDMKGRGNKKIF